MKKGKWDGREMLSSDRFACLRVYSLRDGDWGFSMSVRGRFVSQRGWDSEKAAKKAAWAEYKKWRKEFVPW